MRRSWGVWQIAARAVTFPACSRRVVSGATLTRLFDAEAYNTPCRFKCAVIAACADAIARSDC